MTLADMIAERPDLFYLNNRGWFDGESFMDIHAVPMSSWFWASEVPIDGQHPVRAADLAALYLEDPGRQVWRHFLWTDDMDQYGNRVYVGGVGRLGIDRFQIHRHLSNPGIYWVRAT